VNPRQSPVGRAPLGLLGVLGALFGVALTPLGLSSLTAWLIIPGHLTFCALVCVASVVEGWDGEPERARRWGGWSLVVLVGIVAGIEVGRRISGDTAWVSWTAVLMWGWVPPAVSALAGWLGALRRRRLDGLARRRRR
jgi:hypothetical protein